MRQLLATLTLVAGILAAPHARAWEAETKHVTTAQRTFLTATALNGVATFTITNTDSQYYQANLEVARTRLAGTDLTMTCVSTTSRTATPTAQRQDCEMASSSATCTHYQTIWKSPTSSTETLAWEVKILGWYRTDCTFASTLAGGSDFVAVTGALVSQ